MNSERAGGVVELVRNAKGGFGRGIVADDAMGVGKESEKERFMMFLVVDMS